MTELKFEWDTAKAAANQVKHGVSFFEAVTVFDDESALYKPDPDHSDGEERFLIVGCSSEDRLLTVAHCEFETGNVIRIISARRADRRETAMYVSRRFT